MKLSKFKMIYTISVFIALAAFDNIVIGLFPPLFPYIAHSLKLPDAVLGIISGMNIFVTCISAIFWGYFAGKFDRKKLIIAGTIIWSLSVLFTALSNSFLELFIFQFLTGIGLGCISSIGYSILSDYIHHSRRGLVLSLWGMSQGLGGIIGALMASLLGGSANWRHPFLLVSFIGFLLIFFYIFVEVPSVGSSDPELTDLIKEGYQYNYNIEFNHIFEIVSKRNNILLFFQAFFLNMSTGVLIFLPLLYKTKIMNIGYDTNTALIASGFMYGIFQLGGLTSAFFGHLGDKLQEKTYKARPIITSFFVFITMPLYLAMFFVPMTGLKLSTSGNSLIVILNIISQIFTNPYITIIFILAFFASATQSANTPNWLALITETNLPEHRSTAFSVANFANGIGRSVGNFAFSGIVAFISLHSKASNSYIVAMSIFQVFLVPSALCYILMTRNITKDVRELKTILSERAKNAK